MEDCFSLLLTNVSLYVNAELLAIGIGGIHIKVGRVIFIVALASGKANNKGVGGSKFKGMHS